MGGWQAYFFSTGTVASGYCETVSKPLSQRHVLFITDEDFRGVSEDGVPFCYAEWFFTRGDAELA